MFWIAVLGILYFTFIMFYREAKPLIHAAVILLFVFIPPLFSGYAGFPGFEPEEVGRFLTGVIDYYMEIIKTFAQASTGI